MISCFFLNVQFVYDTWNEQKPEQDIYKFL
jgi:hypothetical protein